MYYKVLKDNKVIDVLEHLTYLKWQPKHRTMVITVEDDAQAILSSDQTMVWHEETLYEIPVNPECYDTVQLVEIDVYEYKKLKMLNLCTPEQIIDELILSLLENNIL